MPGLGGRYRCTRRCDPRQYSGWPAGHRVVEPVAELTRLLRLNDFYLTAPPEQDRVPVTTELAAELDERARALGHADFAAWVGTENYEMRVAEDASWVDRRVRDIIRDK